MIAAGYALCVAAGLAAVTVNELRMPIDVAQGSPGMVAFGELSSQSFASNCVRSLQCKFSHRCRAAESSPEAPHCCRLQSYGSQKVPSGHVQR